MTYMLDDTLDYTIAQVDTWKLYLERMREIVDGDRPLPTAQFHHRGEEIHLSDLSNCPLPAFYSRKTDPKDFPHDDISIMRFYRGRMMEVAISDELKPVIEDGISCTADGYVPGTTDVLVEIKSTTSGLYSFDPKEHHDWIERMAGYAWVHGVADLHLVVLFVSGNMADWMSFVVRKQGNPKQKYIPVAMRSWLFRFTPEALKLQWGEFCRRKGELQKALENDDPGLLAEELHRRPAWQCKLCRYSAMCQYSTTNSYKEEII